jgi:hypothetical protein|tara:strand:+ start:1440 stop:1676 length:237 start_codon:yes stop_codon:yes gene_type:complete
MSTYPSLYDKLNKVNKTQLKERTLIYPNLGRKVLRILENKDFVTDLTVGELADMNGMVTLNGEWLTSLNIYEYFESKK